MTLSDISIRNPVFAWMLMFALVVFGWISFRKLGISQMPDVDFPVINISLTWTGAAPEVMESNVVDIVEDYIMNVEGVREVTSYSSYGQASVTVELELSRNVDVALQEIQTKVAQAQKILPQTLDPPIITKHNPEDMPIMWIAVSSDNPNRRALMVYVWEVLKNKFTTIPGVGQVMLGGYADRNLRIWVDGKKLRSRELTVDDVLTAIQKEHSEIPAGLLETRSRQYNVRSMGEANTVNKFQNLPISQRGGQPVFDQYIRLSEVADVEDGLDDIKRISYFNGKYAVGLGIVKQRGVNAVAVAREVKKRVEDIRKDLPPGYNLQVSFDTTKFIEESMNELEFTLVLSAILTALVTYLFLGSFSSTFNILLSIPTSIMGTFIFLHFFGFTLNTFTLLGLTLAIGIVVDDAIMVLENIARHREMGESLVEGALRGAREITFAAIAATFAIVAIFLPVAFMSGIIGKYFYQFSITITAAVLLSLLEAITLTPMRCSQFLELGHESRFGRAVDRLFLRLSNFYKKLLLFSLNNRILTVSLSIAFFSLTLLLIQPVRKEFVPAQDQSQLIIRLQSPVDSSIHYTEELALKCKDIIEKQPEVLRHFVAVGGFSGGLQNVANISVTMHPPEKRPLDPELKKKLSQTEFSQRLRKLLQGVSKDLKVVIQDLSMRGFSSSRGFPVEFNVQGREWDKLADLSEQIKQKMKESGKFTDVDSNYLTGQPEIQVIPDRNKAYSSGVNVSSIGNSIAAMIGGLRVGQFTEGGHRYNIRVRVKGDERTRREDINRLHVRNNRGELVSLASLVKLEERPSLQSISRINRQRSITIFANPAKNIAQKEAVDHAFEISRTLLPEGYSVRGTGSVKTMSESFESLTMVLLLGILVSYMILASQFSSYLHPITVLISMPFSFSGAILTIFIFNQSINIYSFIALILLMGIVKKNSILLVDFTNQMRNEGMSVREALLHACPIRLRPVLMTSVSTIAAAIPAALSIGPGGETRIAMALAVIGGMIASTLLTLVVVPAVYSLFAKLERKKYSLLL